MIRQLTKCRIISRFGIGVDNVDIPEATKKGIVVTKVPDYCIDEVSDHTMALLLAVVRKIPFINAQVHGGTWKMPDVVPIHRLRGSVLGLVGFGRIPQLVAPKAKAFGMKVIAYDPYVPAEVFASAGVESVDFPTLLKTSDYVSIHSPLVPETKGLFNADAFRQMKPTAYLVNTARGPIIDEAALAEALDAKRDCGRGARRDGSGAAAGRFAALRPRQRHHHAAYELLFRRVARRAADEGREEVVAVLSGRRPQSGESGSASASARNPVNPEAQSVQSKKCKVSYKCASDSQSDALCTYFEVCTLHFELVEIRP